jgi:hypothetical protein
VESDTRQTCGSAILGGAGSTRTHFTMFETPHACVPGHATANHVLEMEHKTTGLNSQQEFWARYLFERTDLQPVRIIVGSLGVLSEDLTPSNASQGVIAPVTTDCHLPRARTRHHRCRRYRYLAPKSEDLFGRYSLQLSPYSNIAIRT